MDGSGSLGKPPQTVVNHPMGRGLAILLMIAAIIVIAAGLRSVQDIVVPILAAAFIAMIAIPLLVFLQNKLRIPRWLSLIVVLTLTIGAVFGMGFLLAQSIADVQPLLPMYEERFNTMVTDVFHQLQARGLNLSPEEAIARMQEWSITNLAGAILSKVAAGLQSTTLVVLLTAFILAEASSMPDKIRVAFPHMSGTGGLQSVSDKVRVYLIVVTELNALMGIVTYIVCLALGVPFGGLLAFLVFFLNYIPTIGAIVGGAIPAIFALVTLGWGEAIIMGAVQVVLGVVVGTVMQPRMLGSRLGLSPLVVLLSLVVWGYLLGVVGMFFAVPLTILVKIILDSTDDLKWIGVLLGDGRSAAEAANAKTPIPGAGQLGSSEQPASRPAQ